MSYDQRFSFLTTSRWLSRFSWLSASRSVAIRSASSQSAELELVGRQRLEVVRPVEPGRAVHRAAGGLDERDVLGLGDVPRALEHDVLEEVGEAGLARDLVLRADVVPEVDRDDGREVVLGDDDAQAVGEALVAEDDLRNGGWHA